MASGATIFNMIGFQFTHENKTDHSITVYPVNSSVNDYMVMLTSGIPATMMPGKKASQVWMANPDTVGVNVDGVDHFELGFHYDDVTTGNVIIDVK